MEKKKVKWYYRPFWVWTLLLSVGPFALPCLIFSPRFKRSSKIIISVIVLGFTCYSFYAVYQIRYLMSNPDEMMKMLETYLTPEQMNLIRFYMDGMQF